MPYQFNQELFEEMARLKDQADVLKNIIPLAAAARAAAGAEYRVLDLACGPGTWVMSQDRHWHVTGMDIGKRMIAFAKAQAESNKIQNVTFQVGDAMDELPFADDTFDFIHARLLQCFMPFSAWPRLLKECKRVLRPGGIIQMVESERPASNKPANTAIAALAASMWAKQGITGSPDGQLFGICNVLPSFLAEAGFTITEEQAYAVNYSARQPNHQIWCENTRAVLKQLPEIFLQMGKPIEETERLCEEAAREMGEEDFCALIFFLSVVARKPD